MEAAVFGGSFVPTAQCKNGKYIRYSSIFHTFGRSKGARCRLLPIDSALP